MRNQFSLRINKLKRQADEHLQSINEYDFAPFSFSQCWELLHEIFQSSDIHVKHAALSEFLPMLHRLSSWHLKIISSAEIVEREIDELAAQLDQQIPENSVENNVNISGKTAQIGECYTGNSWSTR